MPANPRHIDIDTRIHACKGTCIGTKMLLRQVNKVATSRYDPLELAKHGLKMFPSGLIAPSDVIRCTLAGRDPEAA